MTQFFTVHTREGSRLDLYLKRTLVWCFRTIQFDGTVVYSVPRPRK